MKNLFSFAYTKAIIVFLAFVLIFSGSASAKKIYPVKGSDNSVYIYGPTYNFAPGDTFVLKASSGPYSFMELISVNGTASAPVVVINEGGQVNVSQFRIRHCRYLKVRGVGSASANYGFYMTSPYQYQTAFDIMGRSANVEVSNVDINTMGYGFFIKQEASCEDSLQAPNWVLDNISVHDSRITNIYQEGFYAGSTAPNGERSIVCNGVTINPIPLRLGNIKIYNNIIDKTGRGGIQLSNAPYGNNEIYNNTISNCGTELNDWQGNGIVLGAYTSAYVHDNNINQTLSSGIFSLGAGLVRIENNTVNNSGSLNGKTVNYSSSIYMDTRQTNPIIPLQFIIKNNTLGTCTGGYHVRIYKGLYPYATNNIYCNNNALTGGPAAATIETGISYTGCTNNQSPTVNAGTAQTITLPVSSVTLNGSATDADGTIASYQWSQVSGPATAVIASVGSASTLVSALVAGTYSFKLTATDNAGATGSATVTITVNNSTSTTPTSGSSIKIEAESFTQMNGVQTENTQDVGGGLNVGWQDNNDWMDYAVNIATAGTYTVNFRVASYFTGAQFQVKKADGTLLTTVTVPNTGSFQTWQTISAQVALAAGQQNIRIVTSNANGGWNINWWEVAGASTGSDPTPTPPPPTTTDPSTSTGSIKIEAESFTQMSGVQTENTNDVGGGLNVGWQDNNDWMDYSVNIATAGTYTVNFRVASYFTGAQFQLKKSDGTVLTTVTVPNTGSFQNWQTISASVALAAGQQTLRLFTSNANGGWNINWWEIAGASSGTTTNPPTTTTPTAPATTKVEAESYTAMQGIQTENTMDEGGGLNVGWQDSNDWMDYSVNIATAGNYTVKFRVASYFTGAQFQLRNSAGNVLTTVTVPNTGNFQTWTTVTASVSLPAGQQTLRIHTNNANGGWNFNWMEFVASASGTTAAVTGKAEDISSGTTLSVFPAVVKDKFMFKLNNALTGTLKIAVKDTKGEVVKQFQLVKKTSGTTQSYLSIGDLSAGTYTLELTMKDYVETKEIVKQ